MIPKEELAEVIAVELDDAIARYVTNDGGRNREALAFFDRLQPGTDDRTRSQVQATDVPDMVEAVAAQMLPAFEEWGAVEFEARNGDDEPQARLESEVVRSMLIEGRGSEGGFVSLTEAIKDAALMRLAVVSLSVETREERFPETWQLVPAEDVPGLLTTDKPDERIELEGLPEPDGDARENDDGSATPTYTVKTTRVATVKSLCMRAERREHFVCSSVDERNLDRVRFAAVRRVCARADLVAVGFDPEQVKRMPARALSDYDGYIRRAAADDNAGESEQLASDNVEVWRCFLLVADAENSTKAERYEVHFSRDLREVLGAPERCGLVSIATGAMILYPHRLEGVSLAEKLAHVAETKTGLLRRWLDNFDGVNKPRLGVDQNTVSMADVLDPTADVIRFNGAPTMTVLPTSDLGDSATRALDYMDKARSESGGASLDMQAGAMQVATNQTAQGIERQYSTKEMLAASMARTLAETLLRSVFLIGHYLLRTQWGSPIDAKIGGEWVQVDPSTWPIRRRVSVRVGQSNTERMRKSQSLQGVLAAQAQALQTPAGQVMVQPDRIYNALSDWVVSMSLRDPSRYFLDPASKQGQAIGQQQQQAAQQQQQKLEAQQAAMVKLTALLEKYKVDAGTSEKALGEVVKLAIEEAKLTQSAESLAGAQGVAGAALGEAERDKSASEQQSAQAQG